MMSLPPDYKRTYNPSEENSRQSYPNPWIILFCLVIIVLALFFQEAQAESLPIPGVDVTDKFTSLGTLFKLVDSIIFKIGARLLAGLAIIGGGWSIKEMAFGRAFLCFVAAIIIGTSPMWVKNIFEVGDGGTIFSSKSK